MADSGRPSLVTVVVDVDEAAWAGVTEASLKALSEAAQSEEAGGGTAQAEEPTTLASVLKSLVVFLNAVKLMDRENEVAIVAECPDGSARFWTEEGLPVAETLRRGVRQLAAETAAENAVRGSCGLAAALSKALCHSNRVMLAQKARYGVEPQARVIVVQARSDDASQYIASMNAAFAAQKRSVCVDVCDFCPDRSTILQQVAHLAGGILQHYSGISAGAFTEHLFAVFLADVESRQRLLKVPPQAPIVLEAACFCHGELKSRGWVCSVCLSVFCRDPTSNKSTCPTCQTRILVQA